MDQGSATDTPSPASDTVHPSQEAPPEPQRPPPSDPGAQRLHEIMGAVVILGAFALLAWVVLFAVNRYGESSSDAIALIGSITGVAGTMVAAFFGVRAVQSQATQAQQTAKETQQTAQRAQEAANQAQQWGIRNAEAAAGGRALARAVRQIRAEAATPDASRATRGGPPPEGLRREEPDLGALRAMADELFPE